MKTTVPSWVSLRSILAIACSAFLMGGATAYLPGCAAAAPGDLSVTNGSIVVGRPIPPDITLPPGVTWNDKQIIRTAHQFSQWTGGRLDKHIALTVGEEDIVTGKRYVYVRGEAFCWFLWQYEDAISEWDLLAPREATIGDLKKACEQLGSGYQGVQPCPDLNEYSVVLEAAFKRDDFAQDRFVFTQSMPTKAKSPVHAFGVGQPVWQVRRVTPDVLRIRIEERIDICPLIATPIAWATLPFWFRI